MIKRGTDALAGDVNRLDFERGKVMRLSISVESRKHEIYFADFFWLFSRHREYPHLGDNGGLDAFAKGKPCGIAEDKMIFKKPARTNRSGAFFRRKRTDAQRVFGIAFIAPGLSKSAMLRRPVTRSLPTMIIHRMAEDFPNSQEHSMMVENAVRFAKENPLYGIQERSRPISNSCILAWCVFFMDTARLSKPYRFARKSTSGV